jgi:hypothetical protein
VVVHSQLEIAAPTARVWALLIGAPARPTWNKQIESVKASCPLVRGTRFTWKTGGTTIQSQVQLFEPSLTTFLAYDLPTMRSFFHSANTISIWLLCVFSGSFVTACHNALMDQLCVPSVSNAAAWTA